MNPQTVLTQSESWPVEDRLRLMEEIWGGLLKQFPEPGLTDEQQAEIDLLLSEDETTSDNFVPWEVVRSEALKRAECYPKVWQSRA